ncbi:MAG: DNA cytosine methyltransferase [Paenibacillus sp.]|nr:DNA cytosine methyltransferase [Paenibacillus sp.]
MKKVSIPTGTSYCDSLQFIEKVLYGKKRNGYTEDNCALESTLPFREQAAIVTHYIALDKDDANNIYASKGSYLLEQWFNNMSENLKALDLHYLEDLKSFKEWLVSCFNKSPFLPDKNAKIKFIDLFAGIGGFRVAMQKCGGKCVYSSEWDYNAQTTYLHNFGEVPFGDITADRNKDLIPDKFDILCAGFPCQAFSIAGYRKGFEDTRGTLFFDVADIIRRKRPKAVLLENVKNLKTHDGGRTFNVISSTLVELGYKVYARVMNAMEYANIPQNRERIIIVCFDPKQVPAYENFSFPEKEALSSTIHDCIDYEEDSEKLFYGDRMSHIAELREAITSKDSIYQWRRQYVRENKSHVCPTLTANMGTGGHNVPLILTDKGIRKLSPKECINFQGYPSEYTFPESIADSAKYKQAGNSVVVPLIHKICQNIVTVISMNS